jgi:hypothetical protein
MPDRKRYPSDVSDERWALIEPVITAWKARHRSASGHQSVHSAASVPADTTGRDAGKKVPGRKRGLAADILGLVIAVVVLAASAHENAAGTALLDKVAATTPAVSTALAGQGFKNSVVAHGAGLGIDGQVVERNPAGKGFAPQPKRRVAGQTFGITQPSP